MRDRVDERLSRLDACAVSDALDQLGLAASITGLAPLSVRRRVFGQVTTVRLAAGKAPEGSPSRHLGTLAIETAAPEGVVVVEQSTGVVAAGWGGILSTAAAHKGLRGVIVEGPARDIDEATGLGFPVYARMATARTARGRIYEAETGGTIRVGEAEVCNGDWVVADSSGVAFIPAARIDEVLAAAETIAQREAQMAKAVLAGEPVSQVMGARYENMLNKKDA